MENEINQAALNEQPDDNEMTVVIDKEFIEGVLKHIEDTYPDKTIGDVIVNAEWFINMAKAHYGITTLEE